MLGVKTVIIRQNVGFITIKEVDLIEYIPASPKYSYFYDISPICKHAITFIKMIKIVLFS